MQVSARLVIYKSITMGTYLNIEFTSPDPEAALGRQRRFIGNEIVDNLEGEYDADCYRYHHDHGHE